MNKKYFIIILSIVVIAIIALIVAIGAMTKDIITEGEMKIEYRKITFEDMDRIIQENNLENYYILDVRTQEEYREERIPNSILIPNYEIERVEEEIKDKNAYIFAYCRSGRRSEEAVLKMNEMGYTNVYDMGGIGDYTGNTISDL